jgi:hypothetical protein
MVTALSAAIATAWRFINTTSDVIDPSRLPQFETRPSLEPPRSRSATPAP